MSSMFIIILIIRIINKRSSIKLFQWQNLKESPFKVGGLFLPITSPVLVTFTIFLACTLGKVWSTSTLKNFYHRCYIFGYIFNPLMDKKIP